MNVFLKAAALLAQVRLMLQRSNTPQANAIARLLASQVAEIERLGRE
jgi:hypothetical protein